MSHDNEDDEPSYVTIQRLAERAEHAERALKEEGGIVWLAAEMLVAKVSEDVERFHDGPFKVGLQAACEEIAARMEDGPSSVKTSTDQGKASLVERLSAQLAQVEQELDEKARLLALSGEEMARQVDRATHAEQALRALEEEKKRAEVEMDSIDTCPCPVCVDHEPTNIHRQWNRPREGAAQ